MSNRVDYGYDPAGAMVKLTLQVEGAEGNEIRHLEQEIQRDLDRLEAVRRLKAEILKAANGKDEINFKNNPTLKEAYEHFVEMFEGEETDILPEDSKVDARSVPDLLQIVDGFSRRPTTNIEYCMSIGLVRRMNNQEIIIDCSKQVVKENRDQITAMIRASKN